MNRFFIAVFYFSAVVVSICGPSNASEEQRSTPVTERTIEFEGQGGDFAELISDSGGAGYVFILGTITALAFGLLVIAGRKSSKNRAQLATMLAAVSKGKTGSSC